MEFVVAAVAAVHEGDVGPQQTMLMHPLHAPVFRAVGAEADMDGDPQAKLARADARNQKLAAAVVSGKLKVIYLRPLDLSVDETLAAMDAENARWGGGANGKAPITLVIDTIGIRWYDEKANLVHYIYQYEHDERLHPEARTPSPTGNFAKMLVSRLPLIVNTPAEVAAAGITPVPGTGLCVSLINVPIISGDRVIGSIAMEDYEREHAFGESETRLLTTVAASMGRRPSRSRLP